MITHSIDPVTGFPKTSNLLSATILTDECITADAYATSCMVLGLEDARKFIKNINSFIAFANSVYCMVMRFVSIKPRF